MYIGDIITIQCPFQLLGCIKCSSTLPNIIACTMVSIACSDIEWGTECDVFHIQQQSIKNDVFPDAEGWEEMDPDEAAKWAVGSEFPPGLEATEMPSGAPLSPAGGPRGAGWPGQSARFLHIALTQWHSRFFHDSVVARLTPDDIKKARESKQALSRPIVKQKVSDVGLPPDCLGCSTDWVLGWLCSCKSWWRHWGLSWSLLY